MRRQLVYKVRCHWVSDMEFRGVPEVQLSHRVTWFENLPAVQKRCLLGRLKMWRGGACGERMEGESIV